MGNVTPDWLRQLAPAHAPAPVGWWPLAPGWWILLAAAVATIAIALYVWSRPNARLRRVALRELKRLETDIHPDHHLAQLVESLLRRYAVARFGRETVGLLNGPAWIDFVAAHGGKQLAGEPGATLLRMAYGGHGVAARTAWFAGARGFMRGRK